MFDIIKKICYNIRGLRKEKTGSGKHQTGGSDEMPGKLASRRRRYERQPFLIQTKTILKESKKMNITSAKIQERMKKEQPKRVKAVINEYNSGRYGRSGQYLAVIEPVYFKNGSYKQQSFKVVEMLETIKKGYGYGNCNHSESIYEIVEILN